MQGQLGTPFVTGNQTTAVPVPSLTSGVAGIAGELHNTCAVTAAGEVYCWGDNTYGQLGGGTDAGQSNIPVLITGLPPGMIAVTISEYSGCAEAADGGVFCWGFGGYGELGNGGAYDSLAPVTVALDDDGGVDAGPLSPSPGGVAISAGQDQVLLLTASGTVEAWGNGVWGQLGEGILQSSLIPEPISSLGSTMTAVSAGELHSCALDSSGNVWGWGYNQYGDLGDGTTTTSLVPVAAGGLPGLATAISCGGDHSCAVVSGAVYCWGNNTNGELGNGQVSSSTVPVQVVNLSPVTVTGVATTQGVSCAWTSAGAAYCWGDATDGLLGDGSNQQETVPTPVTGLGSGTTEISVARVANNSEGVGHACAVVSGAAYCWGTNQYGELGDGTGGNAVLSTTPVPVVGLDGGVSQVAVGSNHSCALTMDGAVLCWGRGDFGALGNGSNTSVDTPVLVLDGGAVAITAGEQSSCALMNASVLCWGYGGDGELGNGSLVNSNVPVIVE
jgi:alpha-tubulin suppressor-like RCC1 family protein